MMIQCDTMCCIYLPLGKMNMSWTQDMCHKWQQTNTTTTCTSCNTAAHEHVEKHMRKYGKIKQNTLKIRAYYSLKRYCLGTDGKVKQQQNRQRHQSSAFNMSSLAQEHVDKHDAELSCGGDCWFKPCTPTCSNNILEYTYTACISVYLHTKGPHCVLKLPLLGFLTVSMWSHSSCLSL